MIKGGTVYRPTSKNRALIQLLPYITKAPRFTKCSAFAGYPPKKCQEKAWYKYKAGSTKRAHAKTDYYCWSHLFTHAIFAYVYDKERAERAFKKYKKEKLNA